MIRFREGQRLLSEDPAVGRQALELRDLREQLNRLETKIEDICVVARDGDLIAWEYSLLDTGEAVVPLPLPEPKPERPAASIVKLKGAVDGRKKRQD